MAVQRLFSVARRVVVFETIKPFIDAGWHTVPLTGNLERLPDGTKTVPTFEKDWKAKYHDKRNTKATKLGGVLTGEVSSIVAVDCDNTVTWKLFSALCNLDETLIFKSKGKGDKVCGTLIFSYDEELPKSFQVNDGVVALDFYNNEGFVYLPTSANKTKEPITDIRLTPMPEAMCVLLSQLKQAQEAKKHTPAVDTRVVSTAMCLNPLVKQFVDSKKFLPGLFRIITPKDFRTEPEYIKTGTLHPNNVPEGRGSEYLSKVAAILGADISIDEELFCATMAAINKLWRVPMDSTRLDKTILDPMCSGNASINGVSIWKYDETWQNRRLVCTTKRQSSIEIGFDDRRNIYYVVDIANQHVKSFGVDTVLASYVNAVAFNPPTKKEILNTVPLLNVVSDPSRNFGFHEGLNDVRDLNTFIRTPELAIFNEPELYKPFYKPPTMTIRFLESLVPNDLMRNYLIKFIKRKLTYFEYSPVILYFLGVHGSGKDTFMEILSTIMGGISKPSVSEFLEVYNGWLLDSYFVQLDEYGNQLTNMRDRDEALGKLKSYTGSPKVNIRIMRTDSYSYMHTATFAMTANKQPLMLEDGDRRIALFDTPNKLVEQDWVNDVVETRNAIMAEIKDFCYYLATEVPMLSPQDYTNPPETKEKHHLIADSMYPAAKIAYILKHKMLDYLKDLSSECTCTKMIEALDRGRVFTTDLEDLYSILTDHNGDMRALNKLVKAAGIGIKPTTVKGVKAYYYDLWFDSPFQEEQEDE